MKILIYGINYTPELTGIGKYTGEMSTWLAKRGHEVDVVTAPPYYPAWQRAREYSAYSYYKEQVAGVRVWRCPLWVPSAPTAVKRLLHLLSFALSTLPVLSYLSFVKRPDAIIVIEPPIFCSPAALICAHLSGAISWLHIQDFELLAFFGLSFGRRARPILNFFENWLEGPLMNSFDHVSTISEHMLRRLHSLRLPPERTSLLRNWANIDDIDCNVNSTALRQLLAIDPTAKVVLYSGNIGKKQGLEVVLDAASKIADQHSDILFLIAGDGAQKAELFERAQRTGLTNVSFIPLVSKENFPQLLNLADLHLIIQKRGVANAVMPSKLTNILAAGGHAVITADETSELGIFVAKNPDLATLVEPENPLALAETISMLLKYRNVCQNNRKKARKYAEENFAPDLVLARLEQKLEELL